MKAGVEYIEFCTQQLQSWMHTNIDTKQTFGVPAAVSLRIISSTPARRPYSISQSSGSTYSSILTSRQLLVTIHSSPSLDLPLGRAFCIEVYRPTLRRRHRESSNRCPQRPCERRQEYWAKRLVRRCERPFPDSSIPIRRTYSKVFLSFPKGSSNSIERISKPMHA
jgi:hypothetical protein